MNRQASGSADIVRAERPGRKGPDGLLPPVCPVRPAGKRPAGLLASDRAANITGANYVIDGGLIRTT